MTVTVKHKNGNRYGKFNILGIQGNFPVQAITSTNLNHAKIMKDSNFDFKTKIVEIVERYPKEIFSDQTYRKNQIEKFSKIIEQNSDKLCLITISGAKSMTISKEKNKILIEFQIACGFKLIKAFFKTPKNALDNLKEYRTSIPKECKIVPVLDENLNNETFKSLYNNTVNRGDEIIGFLGREPKTTNENNKLNLQYISSKDDDAVIRLVSSIKKSFGGIVSSLSYYTYGFDVYSFITRFGNPNIPILELRALDRFHFKPLTKNSGLTCVVTRKNLHTSANDLLNSKKSSVPISMHDILRLNEIFLEIYDIYTKEELEEITKERV